MLLNINVTVQHSDRISLLNNFYSHLSCDFGKIQENDRETWLIYQAVKFQLTSLDFVILFYDLNVVSKLKV